MILYYLYIRTRIKINYFHILPNDNYSKPIYLNNQTLIISLYQRKKSIVYLYA